MDNREQQLISTLADKIRTAQPVTKDPQAAELIQRLIGTQPDATYVLTQAVLVQEDALATAHAEIRALQERLAQQPAAPAPAGGFMANIFGRSQPQPATNAVPPQGQPFAQSQPAGGGIGKSGFLATAATAAAAGAGGMFLAQGLGKLFSDEHGSHGAPEAIYAEHEQSGYGEEEGW